MQTSALAGDLALANKSEQRAPRYTSYPTADRFEPGFGQQAYSSAVAQRARAGVTRPLSLYVHLPFCRSLCFYCACNKIVTRDRSKATRYLGYLGREIELQAALFGAENRVSGMHWGGGTPTFYDISEMAALWRKIATHFELDPGGEYSLEIDPRTVDSGLVAALRDLGFNRVSFGVQDLDPAVQAAINRVQDRQHIESLIDASRRAGFRSINLDLIYGLPKQSVASFARTLDAVIDANPERIALYNYAHLPELFKSQSMIADADLPSGELKLQLFDLAVRRLGAAGYSYLGMDHFARPHDELAVAQSRGLLRRDFQGYSSGPESDLLGLGVSAIGAIGATYSQNHRILSDYRRSLDRNEVPIVRGIALTSDDLVRRAVIQSLMCQFAVSRNAIEAAHRIDFTRYFDAELGALREFADAGLVSWDGDRLTVLSRGRMLVRSICRVFDRYFSAGGARVRYSRVI